MRVEPVSSGPIPPWYSRLPPEEHNALEAWASTFYGFQRKWLFEPALLSFQNKSRQIGSSHTTGGKGVLWSAFHGESSIIVSIGKAESQEVLDKAARHVRVLQGLGSKMARTIRAPSKEAIAFASGGRIVALPGTGGRSFSGNVILDEYGYSEHAAEVWDAVAPVTTLGYRLCVLSTPNGIGNEFHSLYERANRPGTKWSAHEVTLAQAIEQGYPVDVNHCWELAKGDPRVFDQMFNCSFLDNVLQYVPTRDIDAARTIEVLQPKANAHEDFYAGLDIGREADLTCLVVVRVQYGKDVADVLHVEAMPRTDSDGLEEMVAAAFEKYHLRRLCIDATGMGAFPSDRLKKMHGDRREVPHRRNRVEAVEFTVQTKETLATTLYGRIATGTCRLPDSDVQLPTHERMRKDGSVSVVNMPGTAATLRREIASIRRTINPSGRISYDAPRTSDGHADRAFALALALHAIDSVHPLTAALMASQAGVA